MCYASITFNFQSREEFEATMRAYVGAKEMVKEAEALLPQAKPEPVDTKPVAVAEKPVAVAEKPVETKPEPEAEKPAPTPAEALASIISAIREWVLGDKATNMKRIIPLMPENKKALDALTLPEAQVIAMKLGIEVR